MNEEKLLAVARYAEGDMEPQEKEAFDASFQKDPELQQLLAEYNNVHLTLKMKIAPDDADQQVEERLLMLRQQYFDAGSVSKQHVPTVVSFNPYLKWVSIAAALIVGLLVWAPWSASLYEKYSFSKEMSVAERGEGGFGALDKAAKFYNAGDFKTASVLLEKQHRLEPGNSLVAYYYCIALIETDKLTEARAVLTKLYEGESVFKYDAVYYIALSYVKEKNHKDALTWLGKIPQESSTYKKAEELIKKLQ